MDVKVFYYNMVLPMKKIEMGLQQTDTSTGTTVGIELRVRWLQQKDIELRASMWFSP